ncbi:MAG: SWIM zinc finger family protein [Chloroflexota bacterium]|nr:SWIM zinc finger family protein [Chloroflexota bacterium]
MIGKIEKAKLYAAEPERVTFNNLVVEFHGDNNDYRITLSPDGWDCSCAGFRTYSICPHIMALEKRLRPMLKRAPLPYAPGQNVVSDIEKAKRYADESDRMRIVSFDATFRGDNDTHQIAYDADGWHSDTSFFRSRGLDAHTMALEKMLKGLLVVKTPPQPIIGM